MLSHPGRVRQNNEDACAASPDIHAYVVCDGMGGAAAGEVASHLAAETFLSTLKSQDAAAKSQTRLSAAIQACNQAIYQHARQSADLHGMGTTLVGLLYLPDKDAKTSTPKPSSSLWLVHVGDSRCYLLREGELTLLTADHSLVEEQLRAGAITPEQAALSPMRNLITRAVGSQAHVEPEIQSHHHQPGDLYLLASDGLTRELDDDTLAHQLRTIPQQPTQDDLHLACDALVSAANHYGGHDNITVLLLAFPAK
jgi:PPM family protein phosphatase